ncbi:15-hydroxyprostaglandin dehydrogenase [Trichonephila clavipes]|nr:15-hydroxyprostaglandin dehydrogenase [Trichonephila clavipes]
MASRPACKWRRCISVWPYQATIVGATRSSWAVITPLISPCSSSPRNLLLGTTLHMPLLNQKFLLIFHITSSLLPVYGNSRNTLCCPEADEPTNLEQPTLNHVQSDTMTSAVLVDPTLALQGTNRGSGPVMEESENEVGSLEQLLLYADEHYLAGKLPLGHHLGKVQHGVD